METLAEGSLATESAKTPNPEDETLKGSSRVSQMEALASEVSVTESQGNGVGVSVNKSEDEGDHGVVLQPQMVEMNATAGRSLKNGIWCSEGGITGAGVDSLVDNDKRHVRSREAVEEDEIQMATGEKSGDEDNESSGVAKASVGVSHLIGDNSGRKIEVSGNGISLVVDVHGCSANIVQENGSDVIEHLGFRVRKGNAILESDDRERKNENKKNVIKDDGISLAENGGNPRVTKHGFIEGLNNEVEEEVGEEMDGQEHNFSVGDFVWGKIKSHPWWPGQIYDPSEASKHAAKYHRRDRLLVAYFGDDSFAWCYPSQLKPFQENFTLIASQSNSKNFVNAVEEAVNEFGRRVELEMTCSCVPEETRTGLTRPLAVNTGIKGGIAVPEGGIHELLITQFEPAKFLAHLRYIAQVVPMTSLLELTVLQRQIFAFHSAKGYKQLPVHHQPRGITGPEDKSRNGITNKSGFDGKIEDLALCSAEEYRPGISEEKLHQRKKQRSMAELLAGEMDVEPENHGSEVEEATVPSKLASTSRKKKRSKDSESGNDGDVAAEDLGGSKPSATPSKKQKRTKLSESPEMAENKVSDVQNDDVRRTTEGAKMGSLTRERKKSKYLSPPYTMLSQGRKGLTSSMDSETETPKVPKASHVQSVTRAAGQLTGSPPLVKCGDETFHEKSSKERSTGAKTSGSLNPRTPKENQKKIDVKECNASVDKMLLEFRSASLDPLYLKRNPSSETVKGFFSSFRNSLFHNGSNYENYIKNLVVQDSGKRKSRDTNSASLEKSAQVTDHPFSKGKSEGKKRKGKVSASSASLEKSPQVTDYPFSRGKSEGKKRKGKGSASLEKSPQVTNHPIYEGKSEGKKREGKESASLEKPSQVTDHSFSKGKSVRKKTSGKESALLEKSLPVTGHSLSEGKSECKKRKGKEEATSSSKRKAKNPIGKSDLKINHNAKETNGEASAAALLLTFTPGFPLPSKDDLITLFGGFGPLNELDTKVLRDSGCARIVYTKSSDAEKALDSSQKFSPFGHAVASYRLQYLLDGAKELDLNSQQHPSSPMLTEGREPPITLPAIRPHVGEPRLLFIRENLEVMTSMLEKSGDNLSPESKAKLEGEIKGLLQKVSTMVESSS